jgi:hypothetical protein
MRNNIIQIDVTTKKNSIQKTFWKVEKYLSDFPYIDRGYWRSIGELRYETIISQVDGENSGAYDIPISKQILLRNRALGKIRVRFYDNGRYEIKSDFPSYGETLSISEKEFLIKSIIPYMEQYIYTNKAVMEKEANEYFIKHIDNQLAEYQERYNVLLSEKENLIKKIPS